MGLQYHVLGKDLYGGCIAAREFPPKSSLRSRGIDHHAPEPDHWFSWPDGSKTSGGAIRENR